MIEYKLSPYITITIGLAGIGAYLALITGLRAPFFLGPLIAVLIGGLCTPRPIRERLIIPPIARIGVVSCIAVLFGSRIGDEFTSEVLKWLPSFATVIVFTIVIQILGYRFFRRYSPFDPATAWFAASPGGLVESVIFGEKSGGHRETIVLMQFLRIILILTCLPLAYSIWFGSVPRPTEGIFSDVERANIGQTITLFIVIATALVLARVVRFPGAQMVIPFIIGALAARLGFITTAGPSWLFPLAQMTLAAAIASQFANLTQSAVRDALRLSIPHTLGLMIIAFGFAAFLSYFTGIPLWLGILILAPAGIAEMGIIAFALGADPIMVILHHILRIFLSLSILPMLYGAIFKSRS